MDLVVGGIEIPIHAVLDLSQTYEVVEGGASDMRLADSTALRQTTWLRRPLRTVIQGSGWMPPGLQALDLSTPHVIECASPRSIVTTGLTAELPPARRGDIGPYAYAWDGFGWVETPLSISGDTATLTAVAGAQGYRVDYWPRLTCLLSPPQETGELGDANYSWSLTGEEV